MCVRYIGSKTRVVQAILGYIGKPNGGTFYDAFSGTGAVARAASEAGWQVHVNDHLTSAAMMSLARVTSSAQAAFLGTGDYSRAILELNAAQPRCGFIWREYSPASMHYCGVTRMYFTEENAKKLDGMRSQIDRWYRNKLISHTEMCILVADLLGAANRVANTAGTYGCFLSRWQRQSMNPIRVIERDIPSSAPKATMTSRDVLELRCEPEDTIYFDPPYTKRQYAAYYHILETIALGDEPAVKGVGGIRPWKDKASDYCYKVRAPLALERLVKHCRARRIFLSYSSQGHVSLDALTDNLAKLGTVKVHDLDQVGRYRPNRAASKTGSKVQEVLFEIRKEQDIPRLGS